jgi:hypothetical protein
MVIVGSITGNTNTLAGNVPPKADLGDLSGLAGQASMIDGKEFDGAKAYKDSKVGVGKQQEDKSRACGSHAAATLGIVGVSAHSCSCGHFCASARTMAQQQLTEQLIMQGGITTGIRNQSCLSLMLSSNRQPCICLVQPITSTFPQPAGSCSR